jgi:hypothetical protein
LFARGEISLLLRERLLIGGQLCSRETLLQFPLDLSVAFGRALRFLAGDGQTENRCEKKKAGSFHVEN